MTGGTVGTLVTGLDRIARMDSDERAGLTRELGRNSPMYRRLLSTVAAARIAAFASGLALCVAVLLLAQRTPVEWVVAFVLAGLFGFGWAVVRLADNRFDLLLAVLGSYGAERGHGPRFPDALEDGRSAAEAAVGELVTGVAESCSAGDRRSGRISGPRDSAR